MTSELPVAIVSKNKSKYSETFIHNHVRHLPGRIHYLFDGYLPNRYSTDGGRTSRPLITFHLSQLRNKKPKKSVLQKRISKYLTQNKVQAVLAEYGPSGVEMLPVCMNAHIPLVVHFHGYDAFRSDILQSYGTEYQNMFDYSSAVVTVSRDMYQQIVGLGCPEEKVHLIPYGIDTALFAYEGRGPSSTFVSCGRFVDKKGHKYLIKAFGRLCQEYSSAKLILIGEGPLLLESEQLIHEMGIDKNVEFAGVLDASSMREIYHKAGAYVQHSITSHNNDQEGTPLSILEAGACGLPVIASKHGGIKEVIMDGQTGFLIDEQDTESLYQRMKYVLENPSIAVSMGHRLSDYITENHQLSAYTSRLWDLIVASIPSNTVLK